MSPLRGKGRRGGGRGGFGGSEEERTFGNNRGRGRASSVVANAPRGPSRGAGRANNGSHTARNQQQSSQPPREPQQILNGTNGARQHARMNELGPADGSRGNWGQRFETLKRNRPNEKANFIAKRLMSDPNKPVRLSQAITVVGLCQDMCPEYERLERIKNNEVARLEYTGTGADRRPAEERMVKKFRRSEAGAGEQLPSDLRPPVVLQNTTTYLLKTLLDEVDLTEAQTFIWDRTRGIRNDFSIQRVSTIRDRRIAIDCFERIARFHIVSMHRCSHPNKNGISSDYDWSQDREQLDKTLLSLMEYYDSSRAQYRSANEAEFRAYWIMFSMQTKSPDIHNRIQNWPEELARDPKVQAALDVHATASNVDDYQGPFAQGTKHAIARTNPRHFWTLVASNRMSYLMACVAEQNFYLVRKTALKAIWRAYRQGGKTRPEDWSIAELVDALGFDTEEQVQVFCEAYGFSIAERMDGTPFLDITSVPGRTFPQGTSASSRQIFSYNLVELKRYGRTFPAVIAGLSVKSAREAGMTKEDNSDNEMVVDKKIGKSKGSLFVMDNSDEDEASTSKPADTILSTTTFNPFATPFIPNGTPITNNAVSTAQLTNTPPIPSIPTSSTASTPALNPFAVNSANGPTSAFSTLKLSTPLGFASGTTPTSTGPSLGMPSSSAAPASFGVPSSKASVSFGVPSSSIGPTQPVSFGRPSTSTNTNLSDGPSSQKPPLSTTVQSPFSLAPSATSQSSVPPFPALKLPADQPLISFAVKDTPFKSTSPFSFSAPPSKISSSSGSTLAISTISDDGASKSRVPIANSNTLTSSPATFSFAKPSSPADIQTSVSGITSETSPFTSNPQKPPTESQNPPIGFPPAPSFSKSFTSEEKTPTILQLKPSFVKSPFSFSPPSSAANQKTSSQVPTFSFSTPAPQSSSFASSFPSNVTSTTPLRTSTVDYAHNTPKSSPSFQMNFNKQPTQQAPPTPIPSDAKPLKSILKNSFQPASNPCLEFSLVPSTSQTGYESSSSSVNSPRTIRKNIILDGLATNLILEPSNGFLRQFAENQIRQLLDVLIPQVEQENLNAEADEFRQIILQERYGRRWVITYRRNYNRRKMTQRFERINRQREAIAVRKAAEAAAAARAADLNRATADEDSQHLQLSRTSIINKAASKRAEDDTSRKPAHHRRTQTQPYAHTGLSQTPNSNIDRRGNQSSQTPSDLSGFQPKMVGARWLSGDCIWGNSDSNAGPISTTKISYFRLKADGKRPWLDEAGDTAKSDEPKRSGDLTTSRKRLQTTPGDFKAPSYSQSRASAPSSLRSSGKTRQEIEMEDEDLFARARAAREKLSEYTRDTRAARVNLERRQSLNSESTRSLQEREAILHGTMGGRVEKQNLPKSVPAYWGRVSKFVPRELYGGKFAELKKSKGKGKEQTKEYGASAPQPKVSNVAPIVNGWGGFSSQNQNWGAGQAQLPPMDFGASILTNGQEPGSSFPTIPLDFTQSSFIPETQSQPHVPSGFVPEAQPQPQVQLWTQPQGQVLENAVAPPWVPLGQGGSQPQQYRPSRPPSVAPGNPPPAPIVLGDSSDEEEGLQAGTEDEEMGDGTGSPNEGSGDEEIASATEEEEDVLESEEAEDEEDDGDSEEEDETGKDLYSERYEGGQGYGSSSQSRSQSQLWAGGNSVENAIDLSD